jgi:hypothetical protein
MITMLGSWVSGALPRTYNLQVQVVHYYKMILVDKYTSNASMARRLSGWCGTHRRIENKALKGA